MPLRTELRRDPSPGAIPYRMLSRSDLSTRGVTSHRPQETVSFTYDTGGDAKGVALALLGDGRRLATLTALRAGDTREPPSARPTPSRFRRRSLRSPARLPGSGVSRRRPRRYSARAVDVARGGDKAGSDADAPLTDGLVPSADPAGLEHSPLAGSASATRRFANPAFTVAFHARPAFDPALARWSVLADGAVVRVLSGGEQNITLTPRTSSSSGGKHSRPGHSPATLSNCG